jgi:hypothetical protein
MTTGEQIGLSTAEEPFLFKISDSDRELVMTGTVKDSPGGCSPLSGSG